MEILDFTGGPVDKNLPAYAGDTGSIPGLGRFHMPWSSWACALQQEKPYQGETLAPHLESRPRLLQAGEAHVWQ